MTVYALGTEQRYDKAGYTAYDAFSTRLREGIRDGRTGTPSCRDATAHPKRDTSRPHVVVYHFISLGRLMRACDTVKKPFNDLTNEDGASDQPTDRQVWLPAT